MGHQRRTSRINYMEEEEETIEEEVSMEEGKVNGSGYPEYHPARSHCKSTRHNHDTQYTCAFRKSCVDYN